MHNFIGRMKLIRSLWVELELGLVLKIAEEIRHVGLSLALELEVGIRVGV